MIMLRSAKLRCLVSLLALYNFQPAQAASYDMKLRDIANRYNTHIADRDIYSKVASGELARRLPSLSRADLEREAAFARTLHTALQAIPLDQLEGEDRLTRQVLEWSLRDMTTAPRDYDYVYPAPYQFFELSYVPTALAANPLKTQADRAAFTALLASVGTRFRSLAVRLADQERRGIVMPKRQLPRTIATLTGLRDQISEWVNSAQNRVVPLERSRFARDAHIAAKAATDGANVLLAALGPRYAAKTREVLGLSQYPGGSNYYRLLVQRSTTSDITPEKLRDTGIRLLEENNAQLDALARKLGVPGGRAGLRDYAKSARFIAKTPADVQERYRGCLARIEPRIGNFYGVVPKAPYRAVPLDATNASGMTFGNYEQPSPQQPFGQYFFNGTNLADRSLVSACALIFHELIPGHHLQIAVALENSKLPLFRRTTNNFFAYNEGWAEYASNQAREMGGYDDPNDLLGRLMLNSMIYTRLVVDVGLNLEGWSFEKAKAFMLANVYLSEREIDSEILRYSSDLPAQALAYGSGLLAMQDLRREAEARQGTAFDLRAFHREMVIHGSLPLSVLRAKILGGTERPKQ